MQPDELTEGTQVLFSTPATIGKAWGAFVELQFGEYADDDVTLHRARVAPLCQPLTGPTFEDQFRALQQRVANALEFAIATQDNCDDNLLRDEAVWLAMEGVRDRLETIQTPDGEAHWTGSDVGALVNKVDKWARDRGVYVHPTFGDYLGKPGATARSKPNPKPNPKG